MRAEDTLQFLADLYTSIHPTRKRAVHSLFCIVGNGFEWEDGELVIKQDDKLDRWLLKVPIEKAKFIQDDNWRDFFFERPDIAWREVKEVNDRVALFTYPDNVKDDWRGLMEECREYARKDGIIIPER